MVRILKKNYLYLSWFFYLPIFSEYLITNLTILILLSFAFLGFGLVFIKGRLFEIHFWLFAERNYRKDKNFFLITNHSLFSNFIIIATMKWCIRLNMDFFFGLIKSNYCN